jgi:predicted transcriptional regulator
MLIKKVVEEFELTVSAGGSGLGRKILGGHCGDLLSEVMGNAPIGAIWLTVQGHQNIVAVAVLREMAAIVITGGNEPDEDTKEKANQEGIPLLLWPGTAYDLAGRLYTIGIVNTDRESS